MEDYEKAALESAALKLWLLISLRRWQLRPVPDKLKDFLHHLNSIHQSIQFTMENESEGHLSFLDLDIDRNWMAVWDTKCTASPLTPISTSTTSPLITHPINKRCYPLSYTGPELSVMKTACRPSWCSWGTSSNNSYNDWQIHRALNCHSHLDQPDNEPNSVAFLSFVATIYNPISRVLAWQPQICGLTPH
jgi:hypothetical protein